MNIISATPSPALHTHAVGDAYRNTRGELFLLAQSCSNYVAVSLSSGHARGGACSIPSLAVAGLTRFSGAITIEA